HLALAAVKEALNECKPVLHPERIGVVVGTSLGGLTTVANTQQEVIQRGKWRISPHFVPSMLSNMAAAHISILYNLQGPSYTLNTACSSGADAVGLASILLKSGQADMVIAVGVESILCSLMNAALSSM